MHIQHDAGEGSPYDLTQPVGQIAEPVAPVAGEEVIVKKALNCIAEAVRTLGSDALGIRTYRQQCSCTSCYAVVCAIVAALVLAAVA